ncbi:MAG: type IV pilus biogenesis protein PilP [Pseudomonadota bacterium]
MKHKLLLGAVAIASANFSAYAGLPLLGSTPSSDPLAPTATEVAQNAKKVIPAAPAPVAPAPVATAPAAPVSSPKVEKYDGKPETVISSSKPKAAAAPAPSATPPAPAPVAAYSNKTVNASATFRQLDELRTQNALLQEQVKSIEMRNKINGITGGTTPVAGGMSSTTPVTATVLLVDGIDGKLTASVLLPTGGKINVKVGSNIPGVGTVKSITLNEVCASGKTEPQCLPFANGMR